LILGFPLWSTRVFFFFTFIRFRPAVSLVFELSCLTCARHSSLLKPIDRPVFFEYFCAPVLAGRVPRRGVIVSVPVLIPGPSGLDHIYGAPAFDFDLRHSRSQRVTTSDFLRPTRAPVASSRAVLRLVILVGRRDCQGLTPVLGPMVESRDFGISGYHERTLLRAREGTFSPLPWAGSATFHLLFLPFFLAVSDPGCEQSFDARVFLFICEYSVAVDCFCRFVGLSLAVAGLHSFFTPLVILVQSDFFTETPQHHKISLHTASVSAHQRGYGSLPPLHASYLDVIPERPHPAHHGRRVTSRQI